MSLYESWTKTGQQSVQQWQLRQLQGSRSVILPNQPIKRIIHDSHLNLITSRGGYNLLFLNPSYDQEQEDRRLEYQWLKQCRPHLQPGGVLIWVVPQHLLKFAQPAATS